MEIKTYKKEDDYSYTLGAFPTIELLKNKKEQVIKVLLSSTFKNEEVIQLIKASCEEQKISVNDKLIDKLSNKENVFVVGVFKKYSMKLDSTLPHVLLDHPSNMGNFGTILRSALGFGFHNIAVIKPAIDFFDPKVCRASMGAIFHQNIVYYNSYEEYQKENPNHQSYSFMLQAKQKLQEVHFSTKPATLIFGNEATGLDNKYLSDDSIIIEHSKEIDSLNLPTAVGIALYEYQKQMSTKKENVND